MAGGLDRHVLRGFSILLSEVIGGDYEGLCGLLSMTLETGETQSKSDV